MITYALYRWSSYYTAIPFVIEKKPTALVGSRRYEPYWTIL